MVGSLFSKPVLVIGRRLSILICNLIITLMTIPFFFCEAVWILATARFIIGCCSALIVNASSTYIGETAPTAYKPYLGTTIQLGTVVGIFSTNLVNLSLPYWSDKDPIPTRAYDTYLWRISWSLPIIPAIISTVFWLVFFKNEPLRFLISKAEREGSESPAFKEANRIIRENYNLQPG